MTAWTEPLTALAALDYCYDFEATAGSLRAPFRRGELTIATNGQIIAWVRGESPIAENPKAPPTDTIIADAEAAALRLAPPIAALLEEHLVTPCTACAGRGIMPQSVTCTVCRGDGECSHCGQGCATCKGNGTVRTERPGWPCPTCRGVGRVRISPDRPSLPRLAGADVSWTYLGLLDLLARRMGKPLEVGAYVPSTRLFRRSTVTGQEVSPMLAFRIGELRGAVAPMSRYDSTAVVEVDQ